VQIICALYCRSIVIEIDIKLFEFERNVYKLLYRIFFILYINGVCVYEITLSIIHKLYIHVYMLRVLGFSEYSSFCFHILPRCKKCEVIVESIHIMSQNWERLLDESRN
jgi:hypothetical protein